MLKPNMVRLVSTEYYQSEITRWDDETRQDFILRIATEYIQTYSYLLGADSFIATADNLEYAFCYIDNSDQAETLFWDGAICDGYCLVDDIKSAFDIWEDEDYEDC